MWRYEFEWTGYSFIENKQVTFQFRLYSFIVDWVMFTQLYKGRLKFQNYCGDIMKIQKILLLVSTVLLLFSCSKSKNFSKEQGSVTSKAETMAVVGNIVLCGQCGHIKGTSVCCSKEAVRCGCGAIKGSPGCCNLKKDRADLVLCSKCGHVKGGEECCQGLEKKCGKCGKEKGSPGCCL